MGRIIAFIFGLMVGIWVERLMQPRPLYVPPASAPVRVAPPASKADPLTEIKGIGPAFEQALNANGIRSFADLARQNPDALAEKLGARVTAERVRQWIEEAQGKLDETDS
jgi:predicted flap endonuclease-1-like 5' DNA nuclease